MSRLGLQVIHQFRQFFGSKSQRRFSKAALQINAIRAWESEYEKLSEEEIRSTSQKLRGRARGGENLDKLLPEAFALACVAAKRTVNMRPYDVQLAGGIVMHYGALAELATGEGKTLTASLPTYLNALTSKGVHVATVNDYLAKRDYELNLPIFNLLGVTAGVLQMKMPDDKRYTAYRQDITYGMASEFGFDFLRDRLRVRGQNNAMGIPFFQAWDPDGGNAEIRRQTDSNTQRDFYYAIVDEADSILIDEARTPLIISTASRPTSPEEAVVYYWADKIARQSRYEEHFTVDLKKGKVELTEAGRHLCRYSNPPTGEHSKAMDKLFEAVEKALFAHFRYRKDQHYMIHEEKIVIIDEYTGRRMPDRHWREGLHQAVEAKEGVQITMPSDHAAQVTFQAYFKLYKKLGGMTGTAHPNEREFARVYKLPVVAIPTNRPMIRQQWPDKVFPTEEAKFDHVAQEVKQLVAQGRAVLIGTRSVEKSERLSSKLTALDIKHEVINARQHETEAQVVSRAGQPGAVTIATNMAGRGTDIKLGKGVAEAGGLHVIGTERHDARRVDRQLAGRSGRQGDPGSCQFYLCFEDELLEALGQERYEQLKAMGQKGGQRDWQSYQKLFEQAQHKMERKHYKQRVDLMVYEKQRQEILKELGADPYVD
ncbi:MAG: preprotein translocase subunit SecA [Gemmatales bacterium]